MGGSSQLAWDLGNLRNLWEFAFHVANNLVRKTSFGASPGWKNEVKRNSLPLQHLAKTLIYLAESTRLMPSLKDK